MHELNEANKEATIDDLLGLAPTPLDDDDFDLLGTAGEADEAENDDRSDILNMLDMPEDSEAMNGEESSMFFTPKQHI